MVKTLIKIGGFLVICAVVMLSASVAKMSVNSSEDQFRVVIGIGDSAQSGYDIAQSDGFDVIDVEGFSLTSSPGDPMLPHKIEDIILPPDAVMSTVKVNVISAQKRILDGTYDIRPAGPDVAQIDGKLVEVWGDKNIVDGKNADVYQSDADFPTSPVQLVACSQMRKWKFARVDFSPFQYNPVSKKLTVTDSVEVEISYEKSLALQDATLMNDKVREDIAAERFLNYGEAKSWYEPAVPPDQPSQPTHDYVIITTNAINAGSTKLASFVTHKQSLGFSVLVVTYEGSIAGLAGQAPNHRAEKIRQWLINNYVQEGIEYVLLIGNPSPYESGEGDIPMKMCWPRRGASDGYENSPTDYFYADLTGNWDWDGDQFYGEWNDDYGPVGGVDFTSEVYVGRIPVYSTDYTSLDSILQKMIDYENEPVGSKAWRCSTVLPMGYQKAGYDGAQLAEQMIFDYLGSAGYSNWRMYQQGNGPCGDNSGYTSEEELRGSPGPYPAGQDTLENEWTNDAVYGIVCWWAHGSSTSASVGYSGCWDGTLFQSGYCASLDDDHPAFTYQCSCTNGHPETSNNLQYSILEQGGVATVSATRVSWFNSNVGYGFFNGSTTNSGIGYEYVHRLVQNLRGGDALYNAKGSMNPEFDTRLMNWYDFNLYGDPALAIDANCCGRVVKWEQPPDESYNGIDIRCDRSDGFNRLLADDFNCVMTGPINEVVFWGSWQSDVKGQIKRIHLSIHSDDPIGLGGSDPCNYYSKPDKLLWEGDFDANDFVETLYSDLEPEWFWDPTVYDPPPTMAEHDGIWQYEVSIDSNQFVQQGEPCDPNIYWLDIWVELEPDQNDPRFGWKTSSEHWNDDAVYWQETSMDWQELRYPPEHQFFPESIDLSFRIVTGEEEEPNIIKWEQPPDESYDGIDIRCDRSDGINRLLADDFECRMTGPIDEVVFWGSWMSDVKGQIQKIHLSIHSDDPCGVGGSDPDNRYSKPDRLLWERDFYTVDFVETLYSDLEPEWFWDPTTNDPPPISVEHFEIWQYDIFIDDSNQFVQEGEPCEPIVYWLDIWVELEPDQNDPRFGWKTSSEHWNDDAVFWDDTLPDWQELRYPPEHRLYPDSIDLSFRIVTGTGEPNEQEKPLMPHTKWSQPPIEIDPTSGVPRYCGWDQESYKSYQQTFWTIAADDFRCLGSMPVTSIHWWGSYFGWEWSWAHGRLPAVQPDAWWIGFWSNVPANAPTNPVSYSYPEVLLHSITINNPYRVTFKEVGSDEYYGYYPEDICYQYNVKLEPNEFFWQDDYIDQTQDRIFWISIVALYHVDLEVVYPWGWKTRPWHWMDDAVTFTLYFEPAAGTALDPFTVDPIEDPWGESMDMAFELDTDPNYIKWEQLYTGIRHWPHYEDVNSIFNMEFPEKELLVADDWRCLRRTPVTALSWWGSYIGYSYEACGSSSSVKPLPIPPDSFMLKIWTDVPAGGSASASGGEAGAMTDAQIAQIRQSASSASVNVPVGLQQTNMGEERPVIFTGHVLSTDNSTSCSCGSILYAPTQVDDVNFRAAVSTACGGATVDYYDARVSTPNLALLSTYDCVFTWIDYNCADKDLFGDNLADYVDAGGKVILGQWCYPSDQVNPLGGRIITSAYCPVTVSTGYSNGAYNGDGIDCVHNGVNAYNTSYLDDATLQPGCYTDGTFTNGELSVSWRADRKVYYSAGNTGTYYGNGDWAELTCNMCCCTSPSHPKDVIWEYEAKEYDEVLVGYDKHPHGEPNEPVFRYSVRLPEDEWFRQPDVNAIFWLSVQAVYDNNTPNYDWGWTNHEHVFNDDAVQGILGTGGEWIWKELYDQTGASEDMSFILFTDPNECVNCADYNIDNIINFYDYADFADAWLWTGAAGGYNNSDLDCDGDVDWYDVKIFVDQWLSSCP